MIEATVSKANLEFIVGINILLGAGIMFLWMETMALRFKISRILSYLKRSNQILKELDQEMPRKVKKLRPKLEPPTF